MRTTYPAYPLTLTDIDHFKYVQKKILGPEFSQEHSNTLCAKSAGYLTWRDMKKSLMSGKTVFLTGNFDIEKDYFTQTSLLENRKLSPQEISINELICGGLYLSKILPHIDKISKDKPLFDRNVNISEESVTVFLNSVFPSTFEKQDSLGLWVYKDAYYKHTHPHISTPRVVLMSPISSQKYTAYKGAFTFDTLYLEAPSLLTTFNIDMEEAYPLQSMLENNWVICYSHSDTISLEKSLNSLSLPKPPILCLEPLLCHIQDKKSLSFEEAQKIYSHPSDPSILSLYAMFMFGMRHHIDLARLQSQKVKIPIVKIPHILSNIS
jgi:hypothetical protein